ncbi:MAG: hypothetical protein RL385_5206 [Pseudomonadota bacterium]|jgi:hypothetical protein
MSFGTNPHLAKARAAQQKAEEAEDSHARAMAYREAAHQWERAAAREKPGKRRSEYEQLAEQNRALAEGADAADTAAPVPTAGDALAAESQEPAAPRSAPKHAARRLLN